MLVDGIPKDKLFVKLKEGITSEQEQYVLNGLRNTFNTRTTGILYLSDVKRLISAFDILRTSFVFLIGGIALVIAFFLLLTATTQNIQEALGEYGVLRAVGLTKDEGQRIFLYESFTVVLGAGILGFGIGMIIICLVTSQFYLFVELEWEIEFPTWLFITLIIVTVVTTYLSVYIPMRKIKNRSVYSALKAVSA